MLTAAAFKYTQYKIWVKSYVPKLYHDIKLTTIKFFTIRKPQQSIPCQRIDLTCRLQLSNSPRLKSRSDLLTQFSIYNFLLADSAQLVAGHPGRERGHVGLRKLRRPGAGLIAPLTDKRAVWRLTQLPHSATLSWPKYGTAALDIFQTGQNMWLLEMKCGFVPWYRVQFWQTCALNSAATVITQQQ